MHARVRQIAFKPALPRVARPPLETVSSTAVALLHLLWTAGPSTAADHRGRCVEAPWRGGTRVKLLEEGGLSRMVRSRRTRGALASGGVGCLIGVVAALAPATVAAAPDRYIVVLKDGIPNPTAVAGEHGDRHEVKPRSVYRHALKGYSAAIPRTRVEALRRDKRVDYIEPDSMMHAVGQTLPWGVDKVGADRSSTLAGNGWGAVSNAHAFVVDTGIYRHTDLNVVDHVNFAGGSNGDCHGHGTHVAGTLAARDNASTVVGVAPGTRLTGVKVLDCEGSGRRSTMLAGIDYVTSRAPYTPGPDVANLSLEGKASLAVDDAVRRSAASGVLYAVAAGNEGAAACLGSPARAGAGTSNGIVTVAATGPWDREASFSNHGRCVDIWSPGVDIVSTRKGGGRATMRGTSMASPHVAGNGALYRSRFAVTPSFVEWKLKASAKVPGTRSRDGRLIRRLYVGGNAGF